MIPAVAPPVIARRNTFSSFSAAAAVAVPSQQRVSSFPTALPPPRFDFDFGSLSSVYYTSLKDLIPPPPPPASAAARTLSGECEAVPARSGVWRGVGGGGGRRAAEAVCGGCGWGWWWSR
ncbi:hypothetical protein Scep_008956 [Stephania cephalantha]|uniref:Uncharacterized protein n=1 Tax=Stephania cephalantha TaxID=152367 RepID=A0AAP0JUJ9_9MAGN